MKEHRFSLPFTSFGREQCISPMKSFCLKQYLTWRHVLTLTRLPRFPFQSWQRRAHAGELGFRDFSSLFLVKENRRQLGNPACCIFYRLTTADSLKSGREWERNRS